MKISIIIPTYREESSIGRLVQHLQKFGGAHISEIIVSDGQSDDATVEAAKKNGALAVTAPQKGRAAQMNHGASLATGDIFYFVHADVLPPESFATDIINAVNKGYDLGRYIMKFNSKKWYLRINEFFTRFDFFICYGGDQTLFVTRKLFEETGGFNNGLRIMEDFEFTKRAREKGKYKIFKKGALISARKYDTNSWWQVQMANRKIVSMYKKGAGQQEMVDAYKKMLNYR